MGDFRSLPNTPNFFLLSLSIFRHTLTEEFCREVCLKMDNDNRKKLGVFGKDRKSDPKHKTSFDLEISELPEWKEHDDIFFTTITGYIKQYQKDTQSSTNGKFSFVKESD